MAKKKPRASRAAAQPIDSVFINSVEPALLVAPADITVKGTSGRGTASVDQFSLKGLAQALDKIDQECR